VTSELVGIRGVRAAARAVFLHSNVDAVRADGGHYVTVCGWRGEPKLEVGPSDWFRVHHRDRATALRQAKAIVEALA
jgi:hypothetical protein